MWRFLGLLTILLACTFGVLWYFGWLPIGPEAGARTKNGEATQGEVLKVNTQLEANGETKRAAAVDTSAPRADTITIRDNILSPVNETEISTRMEGMIAEVLVTLGQRVTKDQVLAKLDERLAKQAERQAELEWLSTDLKIRGAELQYNALAQIVVGDNRAGAGVSEQDKLIHKTQRDKGKEDWEFAKAEKVIAEEKLKKVRMEAEYLTIRSNRDGEVVKIYNNRKPGETVRAGEVLFKVVNDNRLRAEGTIDPHLASFIKKGMKAVVEPEMPIGPFKSLYLHTAPVTGIAVTGDGKLLASSSRDQTVILWDWRNGRPLARLAHAPDEVTAIAAGPIQTDDKGQRTYTFLAGCDHARVVLWRVTMDSAGKLTAPEQVELKDGHRDRLPIRSVAFSENGKYAASGGEDYQVCLWDTENGKLLYKVQERAGLDPHRGAVTSLHFLPHGQLLTAGTSDKVLKKWQLGLENAELLSAQKDRTGDVTKLGLTADGSRCLFDTGDELRILNTKDWSPEGTLHGQRQSRFSQFAVFSPAGQTILTVSSGRLQLWAAPTTSTSTPDAAPVPGYEIRQLVVNDASQVTCGAFYAPSELAGADAKANGRSYCFTGGEDRAIRVWEVPPASERAQPLVAEITYVGPQVERGGGGLVPIRAEFDNPADETRRLMAGRKVGLTLFPETTAKK